MDTLLYAEAAVPVILQEGSGVPRFSVVFSPSAGFRIWGPCKECNQVFSF